MIPSIFICPCPPDPTGYCARPEQCLAKRQETLQEEIEVCVAMREMLRLHKEMKR